MKILDRYLGSAVIGGTLLTLAVLLPLIAFFLLADEVDDLGESYTLANALAVASLGLPRYAYHLFPIATLIGALVGLGALASHSELVAMRATGMSIARILYAALKAGLVLAVLAWALGEWVTPEAEQTAVQWRNALKSGQVTLRTSLGLWARDGGAYINIGEIQPGARLSDISIYEVDAERRLVQATHADSAVYVGGQWILEGISRSRISDAGVEAQPLGSATWSSLLNPALLRLVVVEPQALPVWDLLRYVRYIAPMARTRGSTRPRCGPSSFTPF